METSIVSGCETLPDFEAEAVAGAGAGVDEDPAGRLGGMEGGGSSGASNGLDPVGALLPLAPFSGGGPAGGSNGFDIVVYRRCSDEIDNTDLRRHYYRLASSIAVARQISWHLPRRHSLADRRSFSINVNYMHAMVYCITPESLYIYIY